MLDIFEVTKNWMYTKRDAQAEDKLAKIQHETIESLPPEIYTEKCITFFEQIKSMKLYSILQSLPKGALHHIHFDCCEDYQFYKNHVVNDPIVYLNQQQSQFRLGTKQEALSNNWISMKTIKNRFQNEVQFINKISNLTMLNKQEMMGFVENKVSKNARWDLFENKISNFFPILAAEHIFKKYVTHCLKKFYRNGYDRIEYRCMLTRLKKYDEDGNIVAIHNQKRFMDVVDEVVQQIHQQEISISVDFIFFGLRELPPEENQKILTTVLEQRWKRTVGIDFVQQEDLYGDQSPYEEVANRVLSKFPDLQIRKVYHAGQSKSHKNKNIQIAVKANTARIGHAINIFQHPEMIGVCRDKQICIEKCPIAYFLLCYFVEPREDNAALLQGLGVPITINPDDPGKFGYQDSTMDYFFAFISYTWSLKNLKLLGVHSINHSLCSSQQKTLHIKSFLNRWDKWIEQFIKN